MSKLSWNGESIAVVPRHFAAFPFEDRSMAGYYVRFWHLTDIDPTPSNVCFRGQSGHP
jgi:hypothetical protein